MFVYNRSAITVLLPLVLLLAVAWWSNRTPAGTVPRLEAKEAVEQAPHEVAAEHAAIVAAATTPRRRT